MITERIGFNRLNPKYLLRNGVITVRINKGERLNIPATLTSPENNARMVSNFQ
jgi:hypothetical protein